MGVSKVYYGSNTLIDLTSDTVTAATLISGYTAHDKSGNKITGTAGGSVSVWTSAYTVYTEDMSRTISNSNIKTTSTIIPYGQTSSGKPISFSKITVSSGSVTITFTSALTESGSIKLEIIN